MTKEAMLNNNTAHPNRHRGAKLVALFAIPLLVGMLSACSPSAENADAGPESSSGPHSSELSIDDWQVQFASCMRDEGIDMPDPTENGMQQGVKVGEGGMEAFEAAYEACTSQIGEPPASPGGELSDEEFLESQVEMAECLREHGIDVEDPEKGEALTLSMDVPADVREECGGSSGGTTGVRPEGS